MADLDKNPVWDKIKNAPENAATSLLGPSYSYSDNIPGPSKLGVGSEGSFGQLYRNISAAGEYVKIMVNGDPPLGNSYFVNTGGSCTAPDGSVQPRYNYINNFPRGAVPPSMNDLGGLTSNLNGLIPGIVGDIEGLNPTYLFTSLTEEGTPACECYKCNVTSGNAYSFLTPSLSPDFTTTDCSVVEMKNCLDTKETFSNPITSTAAATIVALAGLLFLTFSGK